jgi:hypothetical protein
MTVPIVITGNWGAFVTDIAHANYTGTGYARYTPSTVKKLTDAPAAGSALPTFAQHAIITVATKPVRMRFDGTDPTASEGLLIPADSVLVFPDQMELLKQMRFIDTAAGASEVTAVYGW